MNNSTISARLVSLVKTAAQEVEMYGNDGGFYKGLAVGVAICHDDLKWHVDGPRIISRLFDNAIAHAKAKKEK